MSNHFAAVVREELESMEAKMLGEHFAEAPKADFARDGFHYLIVVNESLHDPGQFSFISSLTVLQC